MDLQKLKNELNELWASQITNLKFDLLNHKIIFEVEVNDRKETKYTVIFSNVSAFYFIAQVGARRFDAYSNEPYLYLEMTSIDYLEKPIGKITINSNEKWATQWYSSATFVVEIWSSNLFIEAKTITINDKTFDVGYPQLLEDK